MSLKPIIAVCGTTGVGKSKLAIELALALSDQARTHGGYRGARVINADAMQVYAGLDILTNKIPVAEQSGVEHLLMGFKQPWEQYVVGQWVTQATRLIDETHERNQIPIVVGGTSYWIQHLIFPERLLATFDDSPSKGSRPSTPNNEDNAQDQSEALSRALSSLPPELLVLFNDLPSTAIPASADPELAFSLHRLLSLLDPTVAQRWHWKDTRKVTRNLVIIKQTGRLPSEIISEQSNSSPLPRYRTLCFWLYARPDVLNPRLDARVDQMIEQGLLEEVAKLKNAASGASTESTKDALEIQNAAGNVDYTLGLYQSIGYREFSSYLSRTTSLNAADDAKALHEAVEHMKLSTRQYAKRQVSWIRNKLLPAAYAANALRPEEPAVPSFLLDATELGEKWVSNVQAIAQHITEEFLEHRTLPDPLSLSDTARTMLSVRDIPTDPNAVLTARRRIICPVCTVREDQPVMIEEGIEWAAHVKTRRHRRLASRASRGADYSKRAKSAEDRQPVSTEDAYTDSINAITELQ